MKRRFLNLIFSVLLILPVTLLGGGKQPYLILISFDGFRWDYPQRGLTPNLERVEKQGVKALSLEPVFPSKTFPNHISTVTGLYPQNHGIIMNSIFDPYSGERYSLGNRDAVQDDKWYLGEFFWETAERQGIITASYFWPGSEILLNHRHPTYREMYEHNRPYDARVQGVLDWLQLPEAERPHFITLYFHETDSKGHDFGPDSPEVNAAIKQLDALLGLLLDGLQKNNMLDKTNIMITSDHGMTNVDIERIIDVQQLLDGFDCQYHEIGPVMMVQPKPGELDSVYQKLQQTAKNFAVYKREDVPEYFHFSKHPFISDIVLIAEMGWSLHTTGSADRYRQRHKTGGNHGYDNHHKDMHGIFYAMGPNFKSGYPTGTVRNIDVYPLLCEIFGIMPRQNLDGDLSRIAFVLKK